MVALTRSVSVDRKGRLNHNLSLWIESGARVCTADGKGGRRNICVNGKYSRIPWFSSPRPALPLPIPEIDEVQSVPSSKVACKKLDAESEFRFSRRVIRDVTPTSRQFEKVSRSISHSRKWTPSLGNSQEISLEPKDLKGESRSDVRDSEKDEHYGSKVDKNQS